jgi:hypothetical protein
MLIERATAFEKQGHQSILLITCREHRDQRQVSEATGVSVRAPGYKLPRLGREKPRAFSRFSL